MARKTKHDLAKEKAAKQKKITIGGGVVFVALLGIQGPKTLKMLHPKSPAAAVSATVSTTATTPSASPADPNSLAAPTLAGSGTDTTPTSTTSSDLVSAVPVTVDPGQLRTFEQFASKDPFAVQAPTAGAASGSGSGSGAASGGKGGSKTTTPPSGSSTTGSSSQQAPPPPPGSSGSGSSAPTSAVISLNGELMSVQVATDFPTTGATYTRSGTLFHLLSLTATTAKVAIAGGSYADGAAAVTLKLRTPVTLQNTADGSKFTLILEPQGTSVPATSGGSTSSASAPAATTTTPASAVPSSGNG